MQAVEEYQQISKPRRVSSAGSEERLILARKTNAQRLARSATRVISDRKVRAEAKASFYNHLMPILEQHYNAQQKLHRTYRRFLACLCGALVIAIAAVMLG